MANKLELKVLINELSLLKTLTQTYQQIAANHIRRTRTSVLKNRDFITELLLLFQDVRVAYREQLILLMKKKKIKDTSKLSLIKHNGRTTVVFIAANTGFYGNIVNKTATMLDEFIRSHDVDVTIIGRVGEPIFKERNPGRAYTFFEFPDASIDAGLLGAIVQHLMQYEKILVFYAQFQTIVSQDPTISALDSSIDLGEKIEGEVKKYLFEPSLEKIIIFFETEIFGLIFEQTLRESQLAKQASRMYSLDQAIQNINVRFKKSTMEKNMLNHRTNNSKQINSLAGMSLWGT